MFSGGLDSTYLAWKMLTDERRADSDTIHLHHVSIRNDLEPMWYMQDRAVKNIVHELKIRMYDFEYSESVFDFPNFRAIGFDSDIYLVAAQKVAQNLSGRVNVYTGMRDHATGQTEAHRNFILDRRARHATYNLWSALVNCADAHRHRIAPELFYPIWKISKLQMMQELPDYLIGMTWYCRTPVEMRACGKCHACKDFLINRELYVKSENK
jgi:hypothetical protein